uniref:Uncharacterized protein n=1 Tax=Rhizophora mucronata TaxID=61149 RepID=A0A2P2R4Z8_RHIMU
MFMFFFSPKKRFPVDYVMNGFVFWVSIIE